MFVNSYQKYLKVKLKKFFQHFLKNVFENLKIQRFIFFCNLLILFRQFVFYEEMMIEINYYICILHISSDVKELYFNTLKCQYIKYFQQLQASAMTSRCPYVSSHIFPTESFLTHIRKCNAPNKGDYGQCKHNIRHIIHKDSLKAHLQTCPDNPKIGTDITLSQEDDWNQIQLPSMSLSRKFQNEEQIDQGICNKEAKEEKMKPNKRHYDPKKKVQVQRDQKQKLGAKKQYEENTEKEWKNQSDLDCFQKPEKKALSIQSKLNEENLQRKMAKKWVKKVKEGDSEETEKKCHCLQKEEFKLVRRKQTEQEKTSKGQSFVSGLNNKKTINDWI